MSDECEGEMVEDRYRLLTDRRLEIPRAVATRYARAGTQRWEELVSDGYLALVEAAGRFDPERVTPGKVEGAEGMFLLWAVRKGLLKSLAAARRRARPELLEGEGRAAGPGPAEQAAARDEARLALSLMPAEDREAVWLHCGLGLTLEEVGRRFGYTRERARQKINRGLAAARKALAGGRP